MTETAKPTGGPIRQWLGRLAVVYKVTLGIGAIGGVVLTGLAIEKILEKKPTPVSEQLEKIRRDATTGSLRAFVSRKVDLHGTGTTSYLFVFTDRAVDRKRPDELVIYDLANSELHKRFSFRPERRPQTSSLQPGRGPMRIQLKALSDADGDGRPDLVGELTNNNFAFRSTGHSLGVPFLIAWDAAAKRYEIKGLISRPPRIGELGGYHAFPSKSLRRILDYPTSLRIAKSNAAMYETPWRFADSASHHVVVGYAAEDVALVKAPFYTVLLAEYAVTPIALEIHSWLADLLGPGPVNYRRCFPLDLGLQKSDPEVFRPRWIGTLEHDRALPRFSAYLKSFDYCLI